ncbi:MAG: dihydrodipicolinate reductase [Vicinamibacterales bacterium]
MPIKVLHVGLGPIGAGVVRQTASRPGLLTVGAVDVDPAKIGRDVGEVCRLRRRLGVVVTQDLAQAIRATRADVVVLCTSSSLVQVLPVLETVLKLKVPIVSTTEELAYPVKQHAAMAKRIDALAKRGRVAVLATGVNPGFVMDALPIALTAVCARVDSIEVDRVQDARSRRQPFQRKIGAGLTVEEFSAQLEAGTVRHVGLAQSISMIADAMGWKLDRISDDIQPKLATSAVSSGPITVAPGHVSGLVQDGVGYRKGRPLITLHMEAYLDAPESFDAVRIAGVPPLTMKISGGVHGDIATEAIVVNSIPKLLQAAPGLRTMRDMVLPAYWGGKKA